MVERVRSYAAEPTSPVEARILDSLMLLDLDDYVQRKIWYRCFEPAQRRIAQRLISPGDTVVDVGAHVGFYTLLFARLVGPSGTVHAFEPVMGDVLERNIELNGYRNVVVHRVAVGAKAGRVRLENPSVGFSSGNWQRGDGRDAREVAQVALDDCLKDHIAFMKIDVEGMEPDVIEGLSESLADGRVDTLMVEIGREFVSDPSPVVEPLLANGYRLRRIGEFGGLHRIENPGRVARLVGLYYLLADQP